MTRPTAVNQLRRGENRALHRLLAAIKKQSWMDMFHVVDPDGNRIYFAFTDDNVHGNPWVGS